MQPAERVLFTEDEYIELERRAATKSELIHGEIVAMAGASPKHNALALNGGAALRQRFRERRFQEGFGLGRKLRLIGFREHAGHAERRIQIRFSVDLMRFRFGLIDAQIFIEEVPNHRDATGRRIFGK